ncbi:hypothetical protein CFAM422_008901 [Trichoderma lentiforme]|uniref:Uncharacterized protein n=1 Tax=Trichoderma lentiforme TaxID=1567552 RepID=A0A9P5C9I5_9HYPO|nr:hypothetical protein CFAM422_008901 [Trichoderma lentiforme]
MGSTTKSPPVPDGPWRHPATCCRQRMQAVAKRRSGTSLYSLNRHLLPASSGHLDDSHPTNLTPLRRPDSRRHATPQMTREDEQGQEAASLADQPAILEHGA